MGYIEIVKCGNLVEGVASIGEDVEDCVDLKCFGGFGIY